MRSRSGYSVTEVMITLGFLVITAFTVPTVDRSLTSWNLRHGANSVRADLATLRKRAMARGESLRVWFTPHSDLYWFQDPATYAWTLNRLPDRVRFQSVSFEPGGACDTYMQPDGHALRSGTIVLNNSRGASDTLLVALSGRVGRPSRELVH